MFWKSPQWKLYGTKKKIDLKSFSLIYFTCGQLSHKHIVHESKQFKENFMEVLSDLV